MSEEQVSTQKKLLVWYMIVPWVITIVLVVVLTYRLDKNQEQSDRDWCKTLELSTQPVRGRSLTPQQQALLKELTELRKKKGCKLSVRSQNGVH